MNNVDSEKTDRENLKIRERYCNKEGIDRAEIDVLEILLSKYGTTSSMIIRAYEIKSSNYNPIWQILKSSLTLTSYLLHIISEGSGIYIINRKNCNRSGSEEYFALDVIYMRHVKEVTLEYRIINGYPEKEIKEEASKYCTSIDRCMNFFYDKSREDIKLLVEIKNIDPKRDIYRIKIDINTGEKSYNITISIDKNNLKLLRHNINEILEKMRHQKYEYEKIIEELSKVATVSYKK